MKYRLAKGLVGISAVMLLATGCESGKKPETEAVSLWVADMAVVDEGESESGSEAESEAETELQTQAQDLSETETDKAGKKDSRALLEESESETDAATEAVQDESKKEKAGSKTTEKETEAETVKQTENTTSKKQSGASQKQSETAVQTEKMSEETEQTEAEQKIQGAGPQTGERKDSAVTEAATEAKEDTEAESEVSAPSPQLRVINDQIIVRSEASTESEKLATLTPGMLVIAIQEDGEWTQIRFQSPDGFEDGYVKTQYLNDLDQLYKVKEKINVRKEADKESAKLDELNANELVLVTGAEKKDWSAILYQADGETVTAYVMTEFLEPVEVDTLENSIVDEEERIMREGLEPESETETKTETESESEVETEAVTEAESEAETEIKAAAESETEVETEVTTESESETESETEKATESETEKATESETKKATESETKKATESETKIQTETVTEVEDEYETGSETSTGSLTFASSKDAQFALTRQLFPEASTVGIVYSADNKAAKTELADYETLAKEYGYELVTMEVVSAEDIDFAVSELVGEVDCVFCMDDATLNDLMQTICAYADEVEIPVFGVQKAQAEDGCLAAYDGTLYWNATEAGKLGKSADALSGNVVTVD